MDISTKTYIDTIISEELCPSCAWFSYNAFIEVQTHIEKESSQTEISTRNASKNKHWGTLCTTYYQNKKAYNYINTQNNYFALLTTITTKESISGKCKFIEISEHPNIFFIYGTEDVLEAFVYNNQNLTFLQLFYTPTNIGTFIENALLIAHNNQVQCLQINCNTSKNNDILSLLKEENKFITGHKVSVTKDKFNGKYGIGIHYKYSRELES